MPKAKKFESAVRPVLVGGRLVVGGRLGILVGLSGVVALCSSTKAI